MDSDRLIRILVTDVLQSYSNNAEQFVDWYAFASSIKVSTINLDIMESITNFTVAISRINRSQK
jgi:hypothetical protein